MNFEAKWPRKFFKLEMFKTVFKRRLLSIIFGPKCNPPETKLWKYVTLRYVYWINFSPLHSIHLTHINTPKVHWLFVLFVFLTLVFFTLTTSSWYIIINNKRVWFFCLLNISYHLHLYLFGLFTCCHVNALQDFLVFLAKFCEM